MALDGIGWPRAQEVEAVFALARAAHLSRAATVPDAPDAAAAARALGLEAPRLSVLHGDVDALLRDASPALLRAGPPEAPWLIALLRTAGPRAWLITPEGPRTVPTARVRDALHAGAESLHGARIDALLHRVPLPPERRELARGALLREHVRTLPLEAGWSLRASPASSFRAQMRGAGVSRAFLKMMVAHAMGFLGSLAAWWVMGKSVLAGHLGRGWLYAWALLLAMMVLFRALTAWWQGVASLGTGLLLKQRMLLGALELDPEEIRHQGSGQVLGRVLEIEAVEDLVMHGGFVSLLSLVELAITIPVLAAGPGGMGSVVLFLAWMAFAALLWWQLAARSRTWSEARLDMTHDLVEDMLGHRTRTLQQPPADWHRAEDHALAGYSALSDALDRTSARIAGLLPRGWLLVGTAALAPAFITGAATPEGLAVGVGGVLLGRAALMRLTAGFTSLVSAWIAWKQAGPLFHAATRHRLTPEAERPAARVEAADDRAYLDVRNLVFRYRQGGEPVLRGVNLRIGVRDRVLLEGPSGGGKSTLGALLAGLRTPESGVLLWDGLDRATWGGAPWRRHVAAAPQFHENHVLSTTFAFNLLMGRAWPPRKEDLREAAAVCRELGLGPLLARMPGGLMQRVGETGWQLSHGERSRLYLARALLQGAEIVILDESFASLDPATLALALECANKRARGLLVIAHP